MTAGPNTGLPASSWSASALAQLQPLAARPVAFRRNPPLQNLDAWWHGLRGRFLSRWPRAGPLMRRGSSIVAAAQRLSTLAPGPLRQQMAEVAGQIRCGKNHRALIDAAAALICQASVRGIGLMPHPVQVAAGLAMHRGLLAEVATGEGKTLAAAIPAVLTGWRRQGCHVVTVNGYLAQRDAQTLGPLYELCGLRTAAIDPQAMDDERRQAYDADVTYVTNKDLTADFLRDCLKLEGAYTFSRRLIRQLAEGGLARPEHLEPVMRGLICAIVDEADSVLIDEAATPLIIAERAPNSDSAEGYLAADQLARELVLGRDYQVDLRGREVILTAAGKERVAKTQPSVPTWPGVRRAQELIQQALSARHLFQRDRHYLLHEDKVVLLDEFTGRMMADRRWQHGLHQAVEAKEELEINPPDATKARISFQRFFGLYHRICGMTGTAWEERQNIWQVYHMLSVTLPTHRPCIRKQWPQRVFAGEAAKLAAVVDEIAQVHAAGRPVLVGTRSVLASEKLSKLLSERGLEHQVLSAVHHAQEAQIIAQAGQEARITVATNMAGRGTDIRLGDLVAQWGGLHVIASERHEAGRIDRQLFGRAARQGDPGSARTFVSMEDELLLRFLPRPLRLLARALVATDNPLGPRLAAPLIDWAQAVAQRRARSSRRHVRVADDWLDEHVSFAGLDW